MIPRPRITIAVEGQVTAITPDALTVQIGDHQWPARWPDHRGRRPIVGDWVALLLVPKGDTRPTFTPENPPTVYAWHPARTPAGLKGGKTR